LVLFPFLRMEEGEWEGKEGKKKEREREREREMARNKWKTRQTGRVPDTWLRLCGREDLSILIGEGILFSLSEIPLIASENSFALLPSMEGGELRCARSGVSFRSERRTAATERPGKADDLQAKVVGYVLSVVRVGCCVSLAEMRSRVRKKVQIHLWKTAGMMQRRQGGSPEFASQGWMMGVLKSR
jgi:hypothetical protein